ncbi:MAG TPA: D-alanine--D-alanine ligase [Longimicrobiales bacterium]|nr:D-alanine--D-alanine ligase [Longimicrobiales bacterium]
MRIAVLLGGNSDERDVSLASGVQVARALREAGHEVVAFDTSRGVLPTDEEARLLESGVSRLPPGALPPDLLDTGDTTALTREPSVGEADVFFLALHGGMGEDGTVQALLDVVGKPYTGSDMVGCALAMDKELTKRLLRDAGIPTPEWMMGDPEPEAVRDALGLPVVVKAARGGSSLRLLVAHDVDELARARELARGFGDQVVWERFVAGREYTVGIVGDEALPVGEIIPDHEIFDYECKYQPGMAREIFPADLPGEMARRLQRMALEVHGLLRLRDFSRVDFVVDGDGRPWCLEANALPGMTANSLLPKAARAAGISFAELCHRIAGLARARGGGVE